MIDIIFIAAVGLARRAVRLGLAALLVGIVCSPAFAQIEQALFRADDGTAYQILRPQLTAGLDHVRITTIASGTQGNGGCNLSTGMSGEDAQAIAGVLPPGQVLHPYNGILRTAILSPTNSTITFDAAFGGRVMLGTGGTALNVCGETFDCIGQANVQTPVGLDSDTGGVPVACIAMGVHANCDGSTSRDTWAFGLDTNGANPPLCSVPADVTVNTTVCAPEPTDGFSIGMVGGVAQTVVLIYDSNLAGLGFAVGSAGFGITGGAKAPCTVADQVFSAQAALISGPAPRGATNTPTNTPTHTPTFTPTSTPTSTATNTPTSTPTNTRPNTPTNTPTTTPASTPTNTPRNTPTNTPTNTVRPSNTPTQRPALEEICRTKGFWKTHSCPQGGCEKSRSSNITQAVIKAAGGSIMVCGQALINTDLNDAMSALEALCDEGGGITQLVSQLTAAALNCTLTSGDAACSGVSIFETFAACNAACASGRTTAMVGRKAVDCIDAIEAFNSNPVCEGQPLCNREIGVCFNDPGPAGSARACTAAAKNECTIFSSSPPCAP